MKTKIIFFVFLFIFAVYTINKINEILLKNEIQNIKYDYQLITDFILIGKSNEDFFLKGKELLEKGKTLNIKVFKLTYYKEGKPIYISSKKGIYFKDKKILKLIENVNIKDSRMKMFTEELLIHTEKDTAETDKDITILSEKMKTNGKRAFIDIKHEIIKVYKAKTIFE